MIEQGGCLTFTINKICLNLFKFIFFWFGSTITNVSVIFENLITTDPMND